MSFNFFSSSENVAPPHSNTGGTSEIYSGYLLANLKSGLAVKIPFASSAELGDTFYSECEHIRFVSAPDEAAFVDTFSFTFKSSNFYAAFPKSNAITNDSDDYVLAISEHLFKILGFGVSKQNESGRNFYKSSYQLGDNWGFLAVGGERQKDTVQIYINGHGCMSASQGWEERLYDFGLAVQGKVSRSDLAHDFYDGVYTVEKAKADHESGLFKHKNSPKNPIGRQDGCWNFEALGLPNKGRTYYVGGGIGSGKKIRVYEKGLQVAGNLKNETAFDSLKDWVRVELELTSSNREIPWDVLLYPAQYLAGSASALEFISEKQSRIKVIKKTVKSLLDNSIENIKNFCGSRIWALLYFRCLNDDGSDFDYKKIGKLFDSLLIKKLPKSMNFGIHNPPEFNPYHEDLDIILERAFNPIFNKKIKSVVNSPVVFQG